MNYIEKFNTSAEEFLERMYKQFPHETKLYSYILLFKSYKLMNQKTPVELFMLYLEPYGYQIMTKDEQFFKQPQYVNNVETLSEKIGLVNYWDTISIDIKNSIWDYFQLLYVLGMKSLNKQKELTLILKEVKSS